MHVQYEIDLILATPREHAVHKFEPFLYPSVLPPDGFLLDGQGEQVVVHWQSDAVEPHFGKHPDISLTESVYKPLPVEFLCKVLAKQGHYLGTYLMLRVGTSLQLHHVRLLYHPPSGGMSTQDEFITIDIQDFLT